MYCLKLEYLLADLPIEGKLEWVSLGSYLRRKVRMSCVVFVRYKHSRPFPMGSKGEPIYNNEKNGSVDDVYFQKPDRSYYKVGYRCCVCSYIHQYTVV